MSYIFVHYSVNSFLKILFNFLNSFKILFTSAAYGSIFSQRNIPSICQVSYTTSLLLPAIIIPFP